MHPGNKSPAERRTDPKAELLLLTDKYIDPVCGMSVDPSHAAGSAVHEGRAYYFCSNSCRQKFQADPTRFLTPHAKEQDVMSPKANERPSSSGRNNLYLPDAPGS